MKKLKSSIDLEKPFANGVIVSLPANKWVVVEDKLAEEMKYIYPFIEMAEATEEDLKEEIKEISKAVETGVVVEKPKRGRPPKKK